MYDFSKRIIVVTGAAKGLGFAMAKRFLQDKAEGVALLDLQQEAVTDAAARLDPQGSRTFATFCDVGDISSVEKAFAKIFERFGRVDILINNAGITRDAIAAKMTGEQFDSVVQISLNGAFYCTRQVIGGMRDRSWGRIVSLSSTASDGNIGQINYSAAKAGLIGFTRTLALELASKNITVNCIAPGLINTDIIKTIPEKTLEFLIDKIPMKRIGEPEEVANLIAFLASDQAAYISGQCVKISGGLI